MSRRDKSLREDRIKKRGKSFVYFLLIVLFFVIGTLFVLIIRGERTKNKLLIQYETERLLFFLSEMVRQNPGLKSIPDKRVTGFGIYDTTGKSIRSFGTAPEHIDISDEGKRSSRFIFNRKRLTVKLVRNLRRRLPSLKNIFKKDFPGRIAVKNRPGGFFLEVSVNNYWVRERILSLSLTLVLLFLGASLVLIQMIYRKNVRYENRLKQQEQLVHLGEAARTLSHEIKNPLGAIQLRTDILKRFTLEEGLKDLRVISEETQRLKNLTDRIHDFLRNPLGNPTGIELNSFFGELLKRIGDGIIFEPYSDGPVYTFFDADRLRSVAENLVRNAAESSGGDMELKGVTVRILQGRKNVTISVLDGGTGIPDKLKEQVFEPFFTTKTQGSGIGLSISKRFVEAAGGVIELIKRNGGGTEVRVILKRG